MPYNRTIRVSVPLTVGTSAYTANDVVGGLLQINIGSPGGAGVVGQVELTDAANQSEPFVLYLFREEPTGFDDGEAFEPTIADLKKLAGRVTIGADDYVEINSLGWAQVKDVNLWYDAPEGQLYGYLVATETPDYEATDDVELVMTVWAD